MEAVETVPQKNNLPTNYFRIPMVWLLGVHHRNLMTQPVVMACRGKAGLHQTKSHLRSGGWFGSFSILKVALDRKLNWIMQVFVTNTLFFILPNGFFLQEPTCTCFDPGAMHFKTLQTHEVVEIAPAKGMRTSATSSEHNLKPEQP